MDLKGSAGRVAAPLAYRVRVAVERRRWAARERSQEWPADARVATPLVDALEREDLDTLNALLPWHAFTLDGHGRPFGRPAWNNKRTDPQRIPDPRITDLDARVGLAGKHVLELGCFEGIHTVALLQRAGRVTATDARVENIVKTVVRAAAFGLAPAVTVADLERATDAERLPDCDVCHHVGVLYHLLDPVGHLERLAPKVGELLWLDTHVAADADATRDYVTTEGTLRVREYAESGRADPFSGTQPAARWLRLDDLLATLARLGFDAAEVVEHRAERNGPRVLIAAARRTDPNVPAA